MSNALRWYFVFVGIFVSLVVVLAILQLIPSTSLEPSYRYVHRYESFVRLLNEDERRLFFEKKYEECAKLLDDRMSRDENLKKQIQKIKEFEAIDVFPTPLMLEYFGYYVYNEVIKYNPNYKFVE